MAHGKEWCYWTVRVAVLVVPRYVPEIVDEVPCTLLVVTVNVALVAPVAIVTEAGTCAAEVRLLVRLTLDPPVGAGPLIVTVPVDELPPTTVLGFRDSAVSVGALTVKVPVLVAL